MRPRRLKNEINVVPYIDVMLVLLVIFMVTTPMMTTGSVDLPSTGQSSQMPDKVVRVMVQADGGIAVKGDTGKERGISRKELADVLAEERARNPDAAVLIAGDKNAHYEAVLNVLDEIKKLDVKRVGLETVRK